MVFYYLTHLIVNPKRKYSYSLYVLKYIVQNIHCTKLCILLQHCRPCMGHEL